MKLDEITLKSRRIYDGKILKLDVDEVELPDGSRSVRECVRHGGGAAVLYVRDGEIALVRQYRYPYKKAIYEIPAGKIECGEEPEVAARREFEEETGFKAGRMQLMTSLYPSPGYTDEIIYIYYACDAVKTAANPDSGEYLNLCFRSVERVRGMIDGGEICDAKTVCAVYKYLCESK